MLRRRLILDLDPPVNWPETLCTIRRLSGFGSSEICFTLNIERQMLSRWESGDHKPNYEHGRAVQKMLMYFVTLSQPIKEEKAA